MNKMNLANFVIGILLLKDANSYNPQKKRHIQAPTNIKKTTTSIPVTPARYLVTNKGNSDLVTTNVDTGLTDYGFPQVEYPSSIIDSSKPFYSNTSPFSDDVTLRLKHLGNDGYVKKTTDNFWEDNEKLKEKIKEQAMKAKDAKVCAIVPNEIQMISNANASSNAVLETYSNTVSKASNGNINESYNYGNVQQKSNIKYEEDEEDMDYVISFINNIDEIMTNLTLLESSQFIDKQNYSHILEIKPSDELTRVTSSMMRNDNDSIIEFNANSFLTDEHERKRNQLFEEPNTKDVSSIISTLNKDLVENGSAANMQGNFCTIGNIANETNSSCIRD